ncbi:MAG TPA: hypothetical protein VIJ51_02440 [Solirubrobacteraceae bacterium]
MSAPNRRPGASSQPSGRVILRPGKRGGVFYARYRLPDGRQVKRRIGPAWSGRGRPAAGSFTQRTAEAELEAILTDARRGTLEGMKRSGATFADAAAEFLRCIADTVDPTSPRRMRPCSATSSARA